MPTKIAIINQKGGVGKTTTTVNLAGAFAEMGRRVLAVDVDSQGDLSSVFLEGHEALPFSVADLFGEQGIQAGDLIQTTDYLGIDVIPADRRLNVVDRTNDFLAGPAVTALVEVLAELPVYDVVLLDCAPRSHLSSFAALCAADLVLVPVEVESFAVRSLAAVEDDLALVRQLFSPGPAVRYFLSKVPPGGKAQERCRATMAAALGPGALLQTAIPLMAGFRSAINVRCPIGFTRKTKPAEIMRAFAREILEVPAHGGNQRAA